MSNNRLQSLLTMYDEKKPDSFVLFAIAKEYEYLENMQEAIQKYEDLKTLDPNYVGLYYHLAKAYEGKDMPEKAIKIYEEGIQIAKKQADFHALSELNNAKINLEMEM